MKMDKPLLQEASSAISQQELRKIPRAFHRTPRLPFLMDNKMLRYGESYDLRERDIILNFDQIKSEKVLQGALKEILSFSKTHLWRNFSELLIVIGSNNHLSDETWKLFGTQLYRNYPNLKCLNLQFTNQSLTSTGLVLFSSYISRNFVSLKDLKLDFGRCMEVSSESVRYFGSEMKHMLNLDKFDIKFGGLFNNAGDVFVSPNKKSWLPRHLKNIRELSLMFSAGKTGDEGLKAVAHSIGQFLPNLQSLCLTFFREDITDEGLEALASQICDNLKSLKKIAFSFERNDEITDEGHQRFVSRLAENLVNLKVLEMSFESSSFFDEKTRQIIGTAITEHLINLEELKISYPRLKFTDEALGSFFGDGTHRLAKLRQLSVEFAFMSLDNISKHGVERLLFCIHLRFPNLINLKLNFSGNKMFNECLQVIIRELKTRFVNIKEFHLLFMGCSGLTDQGIEELVMSVYERRDDLKDCVLNFNNCAGFTKGCKRKLFKMLQSFKNILLEFY